MLSGADITETDQQYLIVSLTVLSRQDSQKDAQFFHLAERPLPHRGLG